MKRRHFSGLLEIIALIILVVGLSAILQNLKLPLAAVVSPSEIYPAPIAASDPSRSYPGPNTNGLETLPYPAPDLTSENRPISYCKFNGQAISETSETSDISLGDFGFSNLSVVYASPNNLSLAEWLPDGQSVLLTRDLASKNLQTIELFNPTTGVSQIYAERQIVPAPPVWVQKLQAVAYSQINVLDASRQPAIFTRQLWLSPGDPQKAELIRDNISDFFLAVDPATGEIVYIIDNKLALQDVKLRRTRTVDFDLKRFAVSNPLQPVLYEIAWPPEVKNFALYNQEHFLLFDKNTGENCEITFDGWSSVARWSPDGKFLAMVRTHGSLPAKSSDLIVLSLITGKLYSVSLGPRTESASHGQNYVTDVAWAPRGHTLVVLGEKKEYSPEEKIDRGLYLVDFISGKNIRLFPEQSFGGGWWGGNLLWSPDGTKLLAACPTEKEERLCLMLVEGKGISKKSL